MVAVTIGLADQRELEIRKALLDACDQCVDAIVAVAAHQGIDIAGVGGPVRGEDLAAAGRGALVPQIDVTAGDGLDVGHGALLRWGRMDRLINYRRFAPANRLPRRSRKRRDGEQTLAPPKSRRRNYLAATTMISTLYCGDASLASTVARAGVLPADTQPSQTAFISWKVFMSVM